jgi:hypothetical protein
MGEMGGRGFVFNGALDFVVGSNPTTHPKALLIPRDFAFSSLEF